jgi:arylsulfatase A-like enzyme
MRHLCLSTELLCVMHTELSSAVTSRVAAEGAKRISVAVLAVVRFGQGGEELAGFLAIFGRNAAQRKHDFLYWEFMGWTAVRQGTWRAVKPARATAWELYDLSRDPGETKDVAAANPNIVAKLTALAEQAHTPLQEGTFATTARHERDRRAKFGKQDDPNFAASSGKKKKQ